MCEMEQHVRCCFESSGSIVKPQSILQMLKGMSLCILHPSHIVLRITKFYLCY